MPAKEKYTLKEYFQWRELWSYALRDEILSGPKNFNLRTMYFLNKMARALFFIDVLMAILKKGI